ncbi:hypothetical protein K9U40_13885 [Xanthobacter autotrophicus]|uniref:hypothetical protein n=1 Tax=Xanthobacter TaxID=279 RepID=UPI0024AB4112|nr:hypothetical protein [Xanthobacter autotrophicus]MDI4665411.1 hypothetical protein [Xanthobacter autotrophicus]
MVHVVRFIPDGFEGLEQAIIRIAKARDPELWEESSFIPGEAAVWTGFGTNFGTVQPDYVLGSVLGQDAVKPGSHTFWRVQSYWWAQRELRGVLFSGRVLGEFLNEHGRRDHFRKEDWATEDGDWVLAQGYAYLDPCSERSTTVFVQSDSIDQLICEVPALDEAGGSANVGDEAAADASPTSAEELRQIKHLAQLLGSNPNLSKSEAAVALGMGLRSRPFELRVWPRGRLAAGLSEQGRAGRKSTR